VALLAGSRQVCGLDYPFTLPRKLRSLGAARLVSTPSRLVCLSGLGSGLPFEVSPNLSSSASPVSQASTQVFLKSAAYAIPPRPRGCFISVAYHRARRGNLHVSLVLSPLRLPISPSRQASSANRYGSLSVLPSRRSLASWPCCDGARCDALKQKAAASAAAFLLQPV
jgi:hypothetical protein